MSDHVRLRNLVLNIQDEVKAIHTLLDPAVEGQWSRSRRKSKPGPTETIQGRQKGTHSDPTGDVAVDAKRLRLRTDVRASEKALLQSLERLQDCRAALAWSLLAWEGEDE